MIIEAFTLFDRKAVTYSIPFFFHNAAIAARAMSELVLDPSTDPGKYPADFELVFTGYFDTASGRLEAVPAPSIITNLAQLLPQKETL